MNWLLIGAVLLAFLAVALAVQTGINLWISYRGPQARKVRDRVQALKRIDPRAAAKADDDKALPSNLSLALQASEFGRKAELLLLQQSRYDWTLGGLVWRMAGWAVGLGLLLLIFNPLPGGRFLSTMAGMALGAYVPLGLLRYHRAKRMARIDQQLPDTIDFIERAMRAGHSFPSSVQMAGQQTPDPLAREFRFVFEQINYGVSLQEALQELVQRTPSADLNYFVVSVLIQRETGGNLTELLRHVSAAVRARVRFNGQLRVLSSEGRASGKVLTALPFGVGGVMFLANPGFMSMLTDDPSGRKVLAFTAVWMAVGIAWMRKIVRIEI